MDRAVPIEEPIKVMYEFTCQGHGTTVVNDSDEAIQVDMALGRFSVAAGSQMSWNSFPNPLWVHHIKDLEGTDLSFVMKDTICSDVFCGFVSPFLAMLSMVFTAWILFHG